MVSPEYTLAVFNDTKIRRLWYENEWWFSVVDVVQALTGSDKPRDYWYRMKVRDRDIGVELSTNCRQLKIPSGDGKKYETDCANTEGIFRIIQSIPSPKAEPFKLWLAKVGYERVQEIQDPELAQDRVKRVYEQKGYSKGWIDKRLRGIAIRHDLTDEWRSRGVDKQSDYAILTAEISKAAFGMTPAEYRAHKGLEHHNLRDHMTDLELIFTMLGEASTTAIERADGPQTMDEHARASREGGIISRDARIALEKRTRRSVIETTNYLETPEKEAKKQIRRGYK